MLCEIAVVWAEDDYTYEKSFEVHNFIPVPEGVLRARGSGTLEQVAHHRLSSAHPGRQGRDFRAEQEG